MHSFSKDPLFAYDDAVAAINAVSDLLTTAMHDQGDHSDIAYGVHVIFAQQIKTLQLARDLVAKAVKPVDTNGVRRIEPMGINMVMVTEPDGKQYMTTPSLAGVDPAGVKPLRFEESTEALRKRVIGEIADDDKAATEIAQSMNLKKETVERVIRQLMARDHDSPQEGNKVVNQ